MGYGPFYMNNTLILLISSMTDFMGMTENFVEDSFISFMELPYEMGACCSRNLGPIGVIYQDVMHPASN